MVQTIRLSNGIRAVLEHLPHSRTVTFGVWVKAGSVNETKGEGGTAHMLEHMFFKGTFHNTAKELADRIAFIGDDLNAFTSKEYTSFYGTTTSENIHELISLTGEMLFESKFEEADIRKEKKVILDEISMYEDSPDDIVHDMVQNRVWKGHPLSNNISGTKSTVRSIHREQLLSFKERFYIPSRMVLSAAGNFSEKDMITQLEEVFGRLREPVPKAEDVHDGLPAYIKSFCYKHKDIEQVHCNLVFPSIKTGMPQRYAFTILNSILGGSNNSRLFQRIREEFGMAYSVYSYTSHFETAGLFHIDITVHPSRMLQALDLCADILQKIRQDGVTKEELRIHKAQISTELVMGNESTKAKMSGNAKSVFLRNQAVSLDEHLEGIKSVEIEDILRLIDTYLLMQDMSICFVGAKESIGTAKVRAWWKSAGGI